MLAMSKMDNGKRIEAACKLKQLHASPRSTGTSPPQAPRVACGRSVDAADAADASIDSARGADLTWKMLHTNIHVAEDALQVPVRARIVPLL